MQLIEIANSIKWKQIREKRIADFVRSMCYVLILFSGLWIGFSIINKIFVTIPLLIVVFVFGLLSILLIRKKKLKAAIILILCISTLHILTICEIASGTGINYGTTHFYFIALALASFFLLYDMHPVYRDGIPLLFFAFFFLFQFGLVPVHIIFELPEKNQKLAYIIDIITVLLIIFVITRMFVSDLTKAETLLTNYNDRLEGLLDSILPVQISERLKREGKTFAEAHEDCSVIFADIENFTQWTEKKTPEELISRINEIFSKIDDAANQLKVTKIKTIGDSYMAAAGIPDYDHNHAATIIDFASRILAIAAEFDDIKFRIGISSGPVVAGIIGKNSFIYDMWGETVNIAARMESSGEAGKINISKSTYMMVKDHFSCVHRGKIQAKNMREIDMYFVELPL